MSSSFKLFNPIEDAIVKINSGSGGGGGVPSTGGTFTGNIIMAPPAKITQSEDPSGPDDLVNLDYLQSNYLPLAGGTVTGEIIQCTAPSQACSLTNRDYVDTAIANATPDATTLVKGKIRLAGDLGGTATTADNPVISNQAITNAKLANLSGDSRLKGSSNTSANATDITLGTSLIMNGTQLEVNSATIPTTIPVPVSQGGTGVVTLPSKYVISDGTDPFSSVLTIPVDDVTGAVKSVNSILPVNGNVTIAFGAVSTGPLPTPAPVPANGSIYIVSGDAVSTNNGLTYISDGTTWNQVISPVGFAPYDARYLLRTDDTFTDGDTLTFPATSKLILAGDAVNATDAVNFNTFNTTRAGQTRFGVVQFDPTGDLADIGGPAANSGIAVVKDQSIGATKLNLSGTSRVFGSNNASSTVTELTMGAGLEITGAGVLQANLSSGVITNTLTSGSNNISSNVSGSVSDLTIGTGTIVETVGLNSSGVLVRAASAPVTNTLTSASNAIVSNVSGNASTLTIGSGTIVETVGLNSSGVLVRATSTPVTNTLTSGSNNISSNVSGSVSDLTIGTGTIQEVVGLNNGVLVRSTSTPVTNTLTSGSNNISSNVNGNESTLTIGTGTMCQVLGLDGSGALIRSTSAPTTNTLTGGNNCISSTVNGIISNLTPTSGTIAEAIGFNSSGVLVKGAVTTSTTNNLSAASNSITSDVNGQISTLTPSSDIITQILGFNSTGSLVTGTSSSALQKANATNYGVIRLDPGLGSDLSTAADGIAKIRPTASNGQLLGSNSTSTTVQNITLGTSMGLNPGGATLNANISYFNGTDPSVTTPDRPATTGILYYGNNGSTWIYNGTNYVSGTTTLPVASGSVPNLTPVTLETMSVRFNNSSNIFELQCSSPGGMVVTLMLFQNSRDTILANGGQFMSLKNHSTFIHIDNTSSGNFTQRVNSGVQQVYATDLNTRVTYLILCVGPSNAQPTSYITIRRMTP